MTTFYGTTGVDVADAEAVMPQLVGFTGGTLTDLLDSLADVFNGGNGQDTIKARVNVTSGHTLNGEGGADELYGGDGADFIDGGTGADYMEGGNGYDTHIIDDSGDVIYDTGSTSDAAYSSLASINLANFTGVELAYLTGALNLNVVGSTASNIIYGNDGNDGNNVIDGRQGDDTMLGGKGNDVYYVDSLLDEVYETASSQFGTQDTIITSVNVRLDTTTTAEGVEHVSVVGTAAVTVVGTAVFNVITGNSGANYLAGYGGNDTVNGGAGTDTVFGGDGKDTLTGGTGDDKFLFSFIADSGGTQPRRDVITDFNQIAGNNDWIDLALTDANGASAGNQAFVFIGTAAFSGAAGELRYLQDVANNRTIIEGNVRVDAASPGAEFSIELTGLKTLTAGASNAFDIIL